MNNIYKPFTILIFFVGILVYSSQSFGQVTSRDSLALVSLYSTTSGTLWANHTNWLTGNVPTWYGIKVSNGRVSQINLPSNNLTGPVTDSLVNLDSLVKVDLSGNQVTSFPALSGSQLDTLSLQGNALTFTDLVPNKNITATFFYSPQDSVDILIDTTVTEQSQISIKALVDYNPLIGDNYHWYFDTTSIVSSAANSYSITCMDSSEAGTYYCAITNSQLPLLTLYRRVTILNISKLANPGNSFSVCDSISTLQGSPAPAGGTSVWSVLSGNAVITNIDSPVTAISNVSIGANVFNYAVSAGNLSCPVNTYSNVQIIITRDTNPSPAYAGANISVCGAQAILHADSPSVGIGRWTVITLGNASIAQPNDPISAVNGLTYGNNIFRWQIVNGACAPAYFSEVKVYRDDTLGAVNAGRDTSICPTSCILTAQLPADAHWAWSVATGSGIFGTDSSSQLYGNDTSVVTYVSGLSEYLNTFKWTIWNTCNAVSSNVNVTVYNFTVANAGPDRQIFYSPINPYPLADSVAVATGGTGTYTYVWSPATNIDSPDAAHPNFLTPDAGSFTYTVTVTDGHGCTSSATVNYTVIKKEYLTVPTLFTPNGDGVNDVLFIPGIESYPNNELTVVDRNDQVVYKKSRYANDWGGINELGFSQQGQKLPADTYYYTLKLEDGKLTQTGFFLIKY